MGRVLEPRGAAAPGLGLPMTLLGVVWGVVGLAWLVRLAGTTASWLAGNGWVSPPFGVDFVRRLIDGGVDAVWPGTPTWAVIVLALLLVAVVTTAGCALTVLGRRLLAPVEGLAQAHEVAPLTPAPAKERARRLRRSLADRADRDVAADDVGLALGVLMPRGPRLRASWEDVLLAVMAPRAGKTTTLTVPIVRNAPGPVLATSIKPDLWEATAAKRAASTGERVWVFDPQGVTGQSQSMWWDPLRGVTNVEEATRLAGHFITEIRGDKDGRDFWSSAAHDLLANLLLAAALSERSLPEVYEWLTEPAVPTAASLLRAHGHHAAAAAVVGRQNGAVETRDGVYETARTAASALRDPVIMRWLVPPRISGATECAEFDTAAFVSSRQTLLLLSKNGAGTAAPLVAALVDRLMHDGIGAAERSAGARLDPPLVIVLDEAANICKISDLPDLYSHLGSRGVVPLTVLQSYRQGVRVWGEAGMDSLWSAATVKLVGAGIDDARFTEDVSRLVGEHDVAVRSYADGSGDGRQRASRSVTTSLRRQRLLPPEDLRAMTKGTALVLATGMRVAQVRLEPYYEAPTRRGDL